MHVWNCRRIKSKLINKEKMRLGLIKKNDNNPNQEPIEGYNGQEDSHTKFVQFPNAPVVWEGFAMETRKS